MKELCQKNYGDKLGVCGETIASAGCFLVSLSMLAEIDPSEVNIMLQTGGALTGKCRDMMDSTRAAAILDLEYNGVSKQAPNHPCIAETDHWASKGIPQHFFVYLPSGRIIDPLQGFESNNNYNIVSFRLFKPKGDQMNCGREIVNYIYRAVKGKFPAKSEIDAWATKADKYAEAVWKADIEPLHGQIKALQTKLKECESKPPKTITKIEYRDKIVTKEVPVEKIVEKIVVKELDDLSILQTAILIIKKMWQRKE